MEVARVNPSLLLRPRRETERGGVVTIARRRAGALPASPRRETEQVLTRDEAAMKYRLSPRRPRPTVPVPTQPAATSDDGDRLTGRSLTLTT